MPKLNRIGSHQTPTLCNELLKSLIPSLHLFKFKRILSLLFYDVKQIFVNLKNFLFFTLQ